MSAVATEQPSEQVAGVAPGVYRFGSDRINWYVIESDDGLTVVDAGLPGHWSDLRPGLTALGYDLDDVKAIVLTHGHSDHVGFAERLRTTLDVPLFVHPADAALARGEGEGAPMGKFVRNLWRPAVLGLLVEIVRGGGLSTPPVTAAEPFADGDVLDVPGAPQVLHVPGHSAGSVAFFLPDRGALLCGDALATVDVVTGRRDGPRLMAMFGADDDRAAASLDRLESLGEVTLLPGHGDPWTGPAEEAVRRARARR